MISQSKTDKPIVLVLPSNSHFFPFAMLYTPNQEEPEDEENECETEH